MKKDLRWFGTLLLKSFSKRKAKTALLVLCISMAVVLVTVFLALRQGVENEMGRELRSFGANAVIEPAVLAESILGVETGEVSEEVYLPADEIEKLITRSGRAVQTVVYELNLPGTLNGRECGVTGINTGSIDPESWHVTGRLPESDDEMLAGSEAAAALGLKTGSVYTLSLGSRSKSFTLTGIAEPGTEENSRLLLPVGAVQGLSELGRKYSRVLLGLDLSKTTFFAFQKTAEKLLPGAAVKTIGQVAQLEKDLLDKISRLLLFVTLIVVFSTAIGVSSTYSTLTLERGVEIGLLKALGSTRKEIAFLFISENLLVSFASAVIGLIAGIAAAEAVAYKVFEVVVPVTPSVVPAAILVALAISFVSTFFSIRRAVELDTALTLKGL